MAPKKKSKNKSSRNNYNVERKITYKDDLQEYAKITKLLGDRRINVILVDKTEVKAIIPGRFRKRCWMAVGDIIIISRRTFQDDKWDVCHKYNDVEVNKLIKEYEIPSFFLQHNVEPESEQKQQSYTEKEDDTIFFMDDI